MVIYKSTYDPIPVPDLDIYTFLFQDSEYNTKRSRDSPQVIDGATGKSLSFNQIYDMSGRLASAWKKDVGLKKGDVVAVFAPNQYDHCVLYFSLLAARCIVSPGNPEYAEAEFRHQISTSGAKALVTIPRLLPVLLKVCDKIGIPKSRIFLFGDKTVDGVKPFYSLLQSNHKHIGLPIKGINSSEDLAFICFSSGTTGLAKGRPAPDTVYLGFLPFYHIFGLTSLVIGTMYRAVPIVIMEKYNLEQFCKLVQKYKVTNVNIVPPVAVHLAKNPIVLKYDLSSLRVMGCGAAPLGREHTEALKLRIAAPVRQGYGTTETTAGVVYQKVGQSQPGKYITTTIHCSIGHLTANTELKLVDLDGNELGDDQEGEVLLRGPFIMKGYLNNPEANAETFTEDGWMRTGDIGKYDSATGEFYIVDRLKELIKYKGFQVAPAELESLLIKHNDVADCCVVGVYDSAQATELPRAYVVLQPTAKPTDELAKNIMKYVADNVTNYKQLRGGVLFVDSIPKNPSGKILRREVKKWIKQEQEEAKRLRARL
ncbi:hypothetical protein VTP01DRAFT_2006 [Rhizomucor pusillus]|uniref:uncharacterized protein n=1 Tax=Rhizomucor pusillus TaxID=4840 RepID=UPI00374202DB